VAVGGMVSVAAALGVAACGGPGSSGLSALPRPTNEQHPPSQVVSSTVLTPAGHTTQAPKKTRGSSTSQKRESPPSPAWLVASAEAAQAWVAATNAFADASYTDDWNSAALAATELQPELSHTQSNLHWLSAAGIVARGAPQILSVQVTSLTGSLAGVAACVSWNHSYIFLATDQPVRSIANSRGPVVFSSEMRHVASGWKLANQSQKEGPCPTS